MKAEERHELNENQLQTWFQVGFRDWIKSNGSYLLLGAALLLLGYQIWNYYQKKQVAEAQSAWSELYATDLPGVENKPIKLQAIIDQYDLKPLRAMALRALGNAYLETIATGQTDEGATALAVDKNDALNRAQAAYERILHEYPDQTLAVGSAKLGLAVVAEDRGQWAEAKQQYEALADKSSPFAGTAVALAAAAQLKDIDKREQTPDLAAMLPPASAPASHPSRTPSAPATMPDLPSILPIGPLAPVAPATNP